MTRLIWRRPARAALGAAMSIAVALPAAADDETRVVIEGGRVTLVATGARLADVLAEWARVGQTRFVDADEVGNESVTVHLDGVAEAEALRILLRPMAGYIAAARTVRLPGASRYDRVKIVRRPRGSDRHVALDGAGSLVSSSVPDRTAPPAHLQRLLDRAAGSPRASVPRPGTGQPAAAVVPAMVATPFPGIAGEPPRPPRWQRRRSPPGINRFDATQASPSR